MRDKFVVSRVDLLCCLLLRWTCSSTFNVRPPATGSASCLCPESQKDKIVFQKYTKSNIMVLSTSAAAQVSENEKRRKQTMERAKAIHVRLFK